MTDGWVVLNGMGGSGKTTLAAEALRDDVLLKDCFPDGVFWLTIGQITEDGQVILHEQRPGSRNLSRGIQRLVTFTNFSQRGPNLVSKSILSTAIQAPFHLQCTSDLLECFTF